ncbi:hypothetical protein ACHHYP_10483 [Achlya hypogyna]|uniref:sn-1-specific diacylglycerol lipase n=1 Tax=Achlya hypogyna TaxID=1202772 RepID=A0A1V9YLA2_ACHHY|nr:hypothetical protein ACHHYP_10483 [Achlya hypogyna]
MRVTPRAYIMPFVLLGLFHHMPVLIAWAVSSVRAACSGDAFPVMRYVRVAVGLHGGLLGLSAIMIAVTLCLPVFRPGVPKEAPLLAAIIGGYAALAGWSVYGLYIHNHNFGGGCAWPFYHPSVVLFDTVVSFLVVGLWACNNYPRLFCCRRATDPALHWSQRCRPLALACVCTDYKQQQLDIDVFSLLGSFLARIVGGRRAPRSYQALHIHDVLLALRLVSKRQANDRSSQSPAPAPSPASMDTAALLQKASYYGRISAGIYGWPMYVYYNPLSCYKTWPCCQRPELKAHAATLKAATNGHAAPRHAVSFVQYTGVHHSHVQYMDRSNSVFRVPFSVLKDDDAKELVVCVRGSFSWHDLVTDGLTQPVALDVGETSAPGVVYAHEGALRTARNIVAELQSAALRDVFWDVATERCGVATDGDWRVVLTGHSLGGAIATLLALLLGKHFRVHGYVFAPMKVVDAATAAHAAACVDVFVYGDDFAPRISAQTLGRLRAEMLTELRQVSNVPLYKVYLGGFDPTRWAPEVHPEWTDWEFVEDRDDVDMQVAGRIFHVEPEAPRGRWPRLWPSKNPVLKCTPRSRDAFDRLWINYHASTDHFPHHYDQYLEHAARRLQVLHLQHASDEAFFEEAQS